MLKIRKRILAIKFESIVTNTKPKKDTDRRVNKVTSKETARDRILRAARELFQQRGYFAVGTAEILERAKAPKGSMYHHFPEGKEQLAIASVEIIREFLIEYLKECRRKDLSMTETLKKLGREMAMWCKKSQWQQGTMLASTAVGSIPDLPKLQGAIKNAFDAWRKAMAEILQAEGWRKAEAKNMATTIIAGIEGAVLLARVDQNEKVITGVIGNLCLMLDNSE